MSPVARSIQIFGIYIVLLGLILLFVPNALLSVFGFAVTNEPWIRVLGVVVAALGYYYVASAKGNATSFFGATVYGRVWLFLAFIALVLLGFAKPVLIFFGVVDLIGAAWTWSAIRREGKT